MAKPKLDRKTLLRNSLSVFKSRGYHGTSVNDLAAANGLLKGSIYHYIESKESLMLEVLNALRDHYVSKVFSKCHDESLIPYERRHPPPARRLFDRPFFFDFVRATRHRA